MRFDRRGHSNRKTDGSQQSVADRVKETNPGADAYRRKVQDVAFCNREQWFAKRHGRAGHTDCSYTPRFEPSLASSRLFDGFRLLNHRRHRLDAQPEV